MRHKKPRKFKPSHSFRRFNLIDLGIVIGVFATLGTVFLFRGHAVPTQRTLPGQITWKNGATNLLFGDNDTYRYSSIRPYNKPSILQLTNEAHLGIIRTWFFNSEPDINGQWVPTTDAMINERLDTAQKTGATVMCVLRNVMKQPSLEPDYEWVEHLVTVAGNRCQMYEFGNENDDIQRWNSNLVNPDGSKGGWDSPWPWQADKYIELWQKMIPRLRRINPNAKFGGPVSPGLANFLGPADGYGWIDKFGPATNTPEAKAAGYYPDFISFHEYFGSAFSDLSGVHGQVLTQMARARRRVDYYYGNGMPMANTEWGISVSDDDYKRLKFDPAYNQHLHDLVVTIEDALVESDIDIAIHFDWASGNHWFDSFNVGSFDYQILDGSPNGQFYGMRDAIAKYRDGNAVPSPAPVPTPTPTPTPSPAGKPNLVVANLSATPGNPRAGDKVNFTVTIKNADNATAPTPNGTAHDVSLRIDGTEVTWCIDNTPVLNPGDSITLSTSSGTTAGPWTAAAGSYTLEAYVDNLGRIDESNEGDNRLSIPLTVAASSPPNQPPVVNLTEPANGTKITAPATVTLSATATDADGSITKVEFFQGTTLLATDTTAPYSYNWSNVAAGNYILSARVTDNSGATVTSANVIINVANPAPSPKLGDLNSDGTVNIFDLGIFLGHYGTRTTTGDLNGDGTVNIFDLGIFLTKYGR